MTFVPELSKAKSRQAGMEMIFFVLIIRVKLV